MIEVEALAMKMIMIEELISKYQLDDYKDRILKGCIPCFEGKSISAQVNIGDSKVGGLPHAPLNYQWPYFKKLPLEFVAQLNCNDIEYQHFPETGLLLFFYDNRHGGYSIKEKGFIHVEYLPDMDKLEVIESPQLEKKRVFGLFGSYIIPNIYKETKIQFYPAVSLPDDEKKIGIDVDWAEPYWELKAELVEHRFIQIGGYPNPVQNDGIAESIAKMFHRGKPEDWDMIFEISDDKTTDMMWGDAGTLHFFTHIDDLKNNDFSHTWMEMQCG